MRILLLLLFASISTISFCQSKNDIIEGLQLKEKRYQATIDSFNLVLNSTKNVLKKEQQVTNELKEKITKLNFETADLRLTVYDHVASIDSLTKVSESQQRTIEALDKDYSKCKQDNRKLSETLTNALQAETSEGSGTTTESPSGNRRVIKDLNVTGFRTTEEATFKFLLYIDQYGSVSKVELVAKNSSDSDLLNRLKREIKSQVRYNSSVGADPIGVYYTVTIKP